MGLIHMCRPRNGAELIVYNIAWGYDDGDLFAHVTTNVSPGIDGESADFFCTHESLASADPTDGTVLFPGHEVIQKRSDLP